MENDELKEMYNIIKANKFKSQNEKIYYIRNYINKALQIPGFKFSELILKEYVLVYINVHNVYGSEVPTSDIWLEKLFAQFPHNVSELTILLKYGIFFPIFTLLNNGIVLSKEFIAHVYKKQAENFYNYKYCDKFYELIIKMSEKFFPDINELENLSYSDEKGLNKLEKIFITALENKCKLTQKTIKNLLISLDTYIFKYIDINTEVLEMVCKSGNIQKIKYVLDFKLQPTENCYHNVLYSKIQAYKKSEIIDLLISYGYKLTYENMLEAIKYKVSINNIEIYDFNFDEKYHKECSVNEFYPYPNIPKTHINLEMKCNKWTTITEIKQIIKGGVQPTLQALHNICGNNVITKKTRACIIDYFLSLGVVPDLKCFDKLGERNGMEYLTKMVILHSKSLAPNNEEPNKPVTTIIKKTKPKKIKVKKIDSDLEEDQ